MGHYIITKKGYEFLKQVKEEAREQLNQATKNKSEAGNGQDGWHDEGFKLGIAEEMKWSKKLADLQKIEQNTSIVEPEEQNETVQLGNGVIIEYEDGTIKSFILDGYMGFPPPGMISVYSPLGRTLLGSTQGEERILYLDNREVLVQVKEIFPPSKAEAVHYENVNV